MTNWHHSPAHRIKGAVRYMVTAGTYGKSLLFQERDELDYLEETLVRMTAEHGWNLKAWAVFPNHYHWVGTRPSDEGHLSMMLRKIHQTTGAWLNKRHQTPGRRVWFNYWDAALTHQASYLARLAYVHRNAVHHGLRSEPHQYRWCSAYHLHAARRSAQMRMLDSIASDRVKVADDF